MRILGIDPGLTHTGWGVIDSVHNRLSYVAGGRMSSDASMPLSVRLAMIFDSLSDVIRLYHPDEAAVEITFVNASNAASALKLGQARGVAVLAPATHRIPVAEYAANVIKKSVVGVGHADKTQMMTMVKMLLPRCAPDMTPDMADALAIAITHAHHIPSIGTERQKTCSHA